MNKVFSLANDIKLGVEIYSPLQRYDPENNPDDYIVTVVEEINEQNDLAFIVDSDGDHLNLEWLGKAFFLSKDEMIAAFIGNKE